MSLAAAPTPSLAGPYRGLAPFGESDADALLFFGRERETEIVAANLIASRLTVLYGPSGVGKSSLLRAGVARRARELGLRRAVGRATPDVAVVVFSAWADEPVASLEAAIAAEVVSLLGRPVTAPPAGSSLADAIEHWTDVLDGELLLVLDQLEEYFVYHGEVAGPGTLVGELPEVVLRPGLKVNVLLSLRADALAELDVFKGRIPNVFANYLRLDRLDRRAGAAAISGPVLRWNDLVAEDERVSIQPELVEAVLAEVAAGRLDLGGGTDGTTEDEGRIEAPYLQLVMERLWRREREAGSSILRLSTLAELGGAESIVRDHLELALATLTPSQRDAAAAMFDHLVTPSGTKIAHRFADLAEYAHVPVEAAQPVLAALGRERILRPLDGPADAGDRYEIFHDVLASAVLAWRRRRELEHERLAARRRQRRLGAGLIGALVLLGLMAGLLAWALSQRSDARDQARHAHARALAAAALTQLTTAPHTSLRLALHAAEVEPDAQAESVLRSALLADRLRSVLPAGAAVRSLSYSLDGGRLATGGADGSVLIWATKPGTLLAKLPVGGPVAVVRYDSVGTRILIVAGGKAMLWNAATLRPIAVLRAPGFVNDAVFSHRGTRVATAGADGLRTWSARDGRLLHALRPSRFDVRVSWSRDGRFIAAVAGGRDGKVRPFLYDVRRGRLLASLPLTGTSDIDFSPDGRLVAASSHDGRTLIWQTRTRRRVRLLDDDGGPVSDLAFSPDGAYLATGGQDGGVRVWRIATGGRFFFFVGHTNPIDEVAFSPGGTALISSSTDRTARLWKLAGVDAGKSVAVFTGHRDSVVAAAFSRDGKQVATGSADGTARLWDARTEEALVALGRHRGAAVGAAFDPSGRLAVSAGLDGTARVWDVERRRQVAVLRHGGAVRTAVFRRDGRLILTASDDGTARLWSRGGTLRRTLRGGSPLVRAVFAGTDRVVTVDNDGVVRVWRGIHRAATLRLRTSVTDLAATSDGALVVVTAVDGSLRLYDARGGALVRVVPTHQGSIATAAISRDGKEIVTSGSDGTARIWSADGRPLRILRGHRARVTDARFDSSGRLVATSSADSNGRIWDTRAERTTHALVGHFGPVSRIAFSADGRWTATAGPISVGVWPTATGRLLFYVRPDTLDLLTDVAFSPTGWHVLTAGADGAVRLYDCGVCGTPTQLEALARARLATERVGR